MDAIFARALMQRVQPRLVVKIGAAEPQAQLAAFTDRMPAAVGQKRWREHRVPIVGELKHRISSVPLKGTPILAGCQTEAEDAVFNRAARTAVPEQVFII